MPDTFIRIIQIHKDYPMGTVVVKALAGATLDVEQNAFSIIMGPSGSGKSTLLYLLGGLDRPTNGSIHVGNQQIDAMDENQLAEYRRKKVGFIFQSFNLIPSMSALENVAFPMRFARVSRKKRLNRAMELLDMVGMTDRAHHKPTELSGGQQQRVAIARALVNNPTIILADEPTGNLDTASGMTVMQILKQLHENGTTLIVVTHDNRNRLFATETRYILDGKIVEEAAYNEALSAHITQDQEID
jgi:putative ABC transport system ATP-binding protein